MAFTMFAIYFSIYIFATCARSKFVQIHFYVPAGFLLKVPSGTIVSALSLEGERTVSFSRQSRRFHYPLISEAIPIFFNRLKSGFFLVRSL